MVWCRHLVGWLILLNGWRFGWRGLELIDLAFEVVDERGLLGQQAHDVGVGDGSSRRVVVRFL